jgi:hypothetical protein
MVRNFTIIAMAIDRSPSQSDLFGDAVKIPPVEPPPVDFVARIRDEPTGTLGRVREPAARGPRE